MFVPFKPTPEQLAVLTTVNKYLAEKGLSPLSEAEIRDWNITGNETDADCELLAHELASEEHVSRCDNKFWQEHDWQNDF